jgi:hypothetical protein
MVRIWALGLVLAAAALSCGCAASQTEQPPSLLTDPSLSNDTTAPSYQLSEQEKKYDCKKLTGAMQVRILQIRDYDSRNKTTLAARGMQGVATPIWGGTTEGLDPDGQHRRDLAMLEAYNGLLAAKNCKTFDLAAELKREGETPTQVHQNPCWRGLRDRRSAQSPCEATPERRDAEVGQRRAAVAALLIAGAVVSAVALDVGRGVAGPRRSHAIGFGSVAGIPNAGMVLSPPRHDRAPDVPRPHSSRAAPACAIHLPGGRAHPWAWRADKRRFVVAPSRSPARHLLAILRGATSALDRASSTTRRRRAGGRGLQ